MTEMLSLLKGREDGDRRCERGEEEDDDQIVPPADPAGCLDTFTLFLPFSQFTRNLWLGLVPSLGGIAIGTVRLHFPYFDLSNYFPVQTKQELRF